MSKQNLLEHLEPYGQEHVLRWWDALSPQEREALSGQIGSLQLDFIDAERTAPAAESLSARLGDFEAPDVATPTGSPADRQAQELGETMMRQGEVALVLVAGGQGTRLKFDGPKGTYPILPLSGGTLFQLHAEKILALRRHYASALPLYVMTSDATDHATRDYFAANDYLGLGEDTVRFFKQGNMPVVDRDWKLLMSSKSSIAMSPDGHGGCIAALKSNGMIEDMRGRGVRDLFYFQVDNVLVQIADPLFMGYHRMQSAGMSLKVLEKRDPEEKLGVVGRLDGRLHVVEYSDLSREQKHARDPDGRLKYRLGSIAIHAFHVDFLDRVADARLPLHRAVKDVPYVDEQGVQREPRDEKNGTKFEMFIFDALPQARSAVVYQTTRERDFAPVKNVDGEDSPRSARQMLMNQYADWLADAGVLLPRDKAGNVRVAVEVSPLFAMNPEQLRARLNSGLKLDTRFIDEI